MKLNKNSVAMESENVLDNGYMCPVTPYSRKACVNSASKFTPLGEEDKDYMCTPIEDVFTRCHGKVLLGMNHIEVSEKPGSYVGRRLQFGDKSGAADECVSENESDGFMTPPPSVGRRPETCPGAPMKSVAVMSRTFDASLCRKLGF